MILKRVLKEGFKRVLKGEYFRNASPLPIDPTPTPDSQSILLTTSARALPQSLPNQTSHAHGIERIIQSAPAISIVYTPLRTSCCISGIVDSLDVGAF